MSARLAACLEDGGQRHQHGAGLVGWLAVAAIVTANVVSLGAAGRRAASASA